MKNIVKKQSLWLSILLACLITLVVSFAFVSASVPAYAWDNKGIEPNYSGDALAVEENTGVESLEVFNPDGRIERLSVPQAENKISLRNTIPLAEFEEEKILDSGKADSESIVITIMGDGFAATEQDFFIRKAKEAIDYMLGNPATGVAGCYPYNLFRSEFTVYAIKVISN